MSIEKCAFTELVQIICSMEMKIDIKIEGIKYGKWNHPILFVTKTIMFYYSLEQTMV